MATPDPAILENLLQRHLDGDLSEYEARQLSQQVRSSPALRREQAQLETLVSLLEEGRIPVEAGFEQRVLDNLPPAAWEARGARAWRLPAAMLVVLAVVGVVLAKAAQPAAGSIVGALSAALELLVTATLTGAGLLGASWTGLQAVFRGLGAGSPWAMVGLATLVLVLNGLLVYALRRRPRLAAAERGADSPPAVD